MDHCCFVGTLAVIHDGVNGILKGVDHPPHLIFDILVVNQLLEGRRVFEDFFCTLKPLCQCNNLFARAGVFLAELGNGLLGIRLALQEQYVGFGVIALAHKGNFVQLYVFQLVRRSGCPCHLFDFLPCSSPTDRKH